LLASVAVLALALGYLFVRAVAVTPAGWLAQYNNTWSDWSFHASYATAFVYGHNVPPQNPIFAGTPFRYPFAPDFASALLIAGGWSIPAALIWPSWGMTLLALSGLILWARRLTGSVWAGIIAVTLTLLGGGLDESPQAYKRIEEVMAAQTDLVDVLGTFTPRIVKMANERGVD